MLKQQILSCKGRLRKILQQTSNYKTYLLCLFSSVYTIGRNLWNPLTGYKGLLLCVISNNQLVILR